MIADVAMESEASSLDETSQDALAREELMLQRKAVMLEEFLRTNGSQTAAERRRILQQRIEAAEEEILRIRKFAEVNWYLQRCDYASPEFVAISHDEFMAWLKTYHPFGMTRLTVTNRSDVTPTLVQRHSPTGNSLPDDSISHRPKRVRTSEKDRPPCLRCKILKKKCDSLERCSHCPEQGYDNESDYWKVLGCFREKLREFSKVFCPDYTRSTSRTLRYRSGLTEPINLILTKSKVSTQKKRRIAHLVQTRIDFAELADLSWGDVGERKSVSQAATVFINFGDENDPFRSGNISLEDYEATWSVLQAIAMDSGYLTETEYNLFTLIRYGNRHSKVVPASWLLFGQAKRLLRQAVEVYRLERLRANMVSGEMTEPPPFYPASSKNLILVDIKEEVEIFLETFEAACSGRAKLTGQLQLACFYSLLVFGIAKSMLIDAYSLRGKYEDVNPWKDMDAARINSAYKALLSVYCWSSKTDIILQNEHDFEDTSIYGALRDTQLLVHKSHWVYRGFKGTKDFLLSLGSCSFSSGTYNGFLPQKFGLEAIQKASAKALADEGNTKTTSRRNGIDFAGGSDGQGAFVRLPFDGEKQSSPSIMSTFSAVPLPNANTRLDGRGMTSEGAPLLQDETSTAQFQNTWEVTMSDVGSSSEPTAGSLSTITFIGHNEQGRPNSPAYRTGGRKGPLYEANRHKARNIRKIRACWNCWVMKVPCSEGEICDKCRKRAHLPMDQCIRASFQDCIDAYFPEFLFSQFSKRAIELYVNENITRFLDQEMEVEITWGGEAAITLLTHTFLPVSNSMVQMAYQSQDGQQLGVESLPIGILAMVPSDVETKYLEHLKSELATPAYLNRTSNRRTSSISKWALNGAFRLSMSTQHKHSLLRDLLLLYLGFCNLSRSIILTDSSAASISPQFGFEYTDEKLYSSRLLNRQLKCIMYRLSRQMTKDVLDQLEKLLRSRSTSLWPVTFSALILFFLCIEQIQILADAEIETRKSSGTEFVAGLENEPQKSCQQLEDVSFTRVTQLFHEIYKTNKQERSGTVSSGGFNPFKDAFKIDGDGVDWDTDTSGMIMEVRMNFKKNYPEIVEWAKGLSFDGGPEDFAKRNSGRLVAKFLLSFIDAEMRLSFEGAGRKGVED